MCNLTFAFPASRPSKRLRLFGRFRTPCGAVVGAVACPARFAEGLFFSDVSGADQRPSRGRSAGPDFSPMRNRGKNRLGRSPLRTSLGVRGCPCVKPTVGPGTSGVTWMVWQVYGPCPLLCETAPLLPGPYPGVRRSRRRQVSTRPKSLPQGGRWHGVSRVGGRLQQELKVFDAMGGAFRTVQNV